MDMVNVAKGVALFIIFAVVTIFALCIFGAIGGGLSGLADFGAWRAMKK